jgi:hypothetical protein
MPELELTGFSASEFDDLMTVIGRVPDLPEAANAEGETIDEALAANERRFVIVVPTKEDAIRVKAVLVDYGMTSPKQGGHALVALIDELTRLKGDAPAAATPTKRSRKKTEEA